MMMTLRMCSLFSPLQTLHCFKPMVTAWHSPTGMRRLRRNDGLVRGIRFLRLSATDDGPDDPEDEQDSDDPGENDEPDALPFRTHGDVRGLIFRSEERRVGKECTYRVLSSHY